MPSRSRYVRGRPSATPAPASHRPPDTERNLAHWRINGYPATIFIWTAAEWDDLADRPVDAQYYPCGVWVALRIDPCPSEARR